MGPDLWRLAHGINARPVVPDREAKSLSHETTFEVDVANADVLRAWLLELTEQVARRLRRHELRGWIVHLKVRFADFQTITRSQTLPEPSSSTGVLWQSASEILATRLPARHLPVRLLGMGVSGIDRSQLAQKRLFDRHASGENSSLDEVSDQIAERFGTTALRRGSSLEQDVRHADRPPGSM